MWQVNSIYIPTEKHTQLAPFYLLKLNIKCGVQSWGNTNSMIFSISTAIYKLETSLPAQKKWM